QNDVTLKMPAFEWVHVQLHQQKGMISLSPPTICNSALKYADVVLLESPLSPYHFFTPGVTTQATALATPGVVIALCRCF
ncbi:hypothetical protein, partial [Klebsiella pneumoniae]|uniref:hypothetical protein n=1 Tax=Klebsiella pneumoniae TaxID=573 RepID=UPI002FF1E73C